MMERIVKRGQQMLDELSTKLAEMTIEILKIRRQVGGETEDWREMETLLEIYIQAQGVVPMRLPGEGSHVLQKIGRQNLKTLNRIQSPTLSAQ